MCLVDFGHMVIHKHPHPYLVLILFHQFFSVEPWYNANLWVKLVRASAGS